MTVQDQFRFNEISKKLTHAEMDELYSIITREADDDVFIATIPWLQNGLEKFRYELIDSTIIPKVFSVVNDWVNYLQAELHASISNKIVCEKFGFIETSVSGVTWILVFYVSGYEIKVDIRKVVPLPAKQWKGIND